VVSGEKLQMSSVSQLATRNSQLLAWHGWRVAVPDAWNPVKVDGDWSAGLMLLADMHQAKLGIRWRTIKRGDPAKLATRALEAEVGRLAAKEATDFAMPTESAWRVSKLYTESDPPGRDIWFGWSNTSGRVIEIVHHVKRREATLAETVLPTVQDTPRDAEQAWSMFDLSCKSPPGWALQWYRLNAGDLTLAFTRKRQQVRVRQVGPASLALARMKLDDWMGQLDKAYRKIYRPAEDLADASLELPTRTIGGRSGVLNRKKRLFWAVTYARQLKVIAFHDEVRNRLLLAQGDDEKVMTEMLKTMGWSKTSD
jgi:hypothetical protein